ncbi:MAG: hypothetical protein GY909_03880 [Oligoflexia bacterium]|nr:hypothetical protein [Oligoflexia bacterium]
MKNLVLLVVLAISTAAFSNTGNMRTKIDNSQAINIQGEFQQKPMTEAQKLKVIRKKLEKQNELLVKKKIEMMRYQQEVMLMKKMQKVFNDQMKKIENL